MSAVVVDGEPSTFLYLPRFFSFVLVRWNANISSHHLVPDRAGVTRRVHVLGASGAGGENLSGIVRRGIISPSRFQPVSSVQEANRKREKEICYPERWLSGRKHRFAKAACG